MNDIDQLWERLQEVNVKDPSDLVPQDIDDIVTFYRYRRTRKATLVKDDSKALESIVPRPEAKIEPGAVRRHLFKRA